MGKYSLYIVSFNNKMNVQCELVCKLRFSVTPVASQPCISTYLLLKERSLRVENRHFAPTIPLIVYFGHQNDHKMYILVIKILYLNLRAKFEIYSAVFSIKLFHLQG